MLGPQRFSLSDDRGGFGGGGGLAGGDPVDFLRHEAAIHRHLHPRATKRLFGSLPRDATDLEHDPTRLDDGHPILWVALARPHTCLSRLLRHRLVRKNPDPDLTTA